MRKKDMSKLDEEHIIQVGLPDISLDFQGKTIVSKDFDDIYFQHEQGLEESRYVFCEGTDLPSLISRRNHVIIAETGFGTGLNLLSVLDLRNAINPDCYIEFISFELCPLTSDIMKWTHRPYSEISMLSELLCAHLPPRWPGYHKVILPQQRTHLHLYYGPAESFLLPSNKTVSFQADIWFLDGFNPAKNPDLWSNELFQAIYRNTAPSGRLATFTAAGKVRRGLEQAGFTIEKRPGFGKKRDMTTAQKIGQEAAFASPSKKAVIIGGGIAGASLSYALYQRGIPSLILEQGPTLASGASGNGAAMQSARLRVHNDAASRLSVACLSYAKRLSDEAKVIAAHGAVTINNRDKDQKRLDKLAQSGWPADLFQSLTADEIENLTCLPATRAGEWQEASAVIYPAKLTSYLAQNAEIITNYKVKGILKQGDSYLIHNDDGQDIEADFIFLAAGADMPALLDGAGLPSLECQISAGQVSFWQEPTALSNVPIGVNYGGYMTPAIDGYQYFGASFHRDGQTDVTIEGHQHNIDLLPEAWRMQAPPIKEAKGRLSHRLSTRDRMPLCGPLEDGIYMLCGLGARGMTNAPLLADCLVAMALGYPTGFDHEVIEALAPQNAFAK